MNVLGELPQNHPVDGSSLHALERLAHACESATTGKLMCTTPTPATTPAANLSVLEPQTECSSSWPYSQHAFANKTNNLGAPGLDRCTQQLNPLIQPSES